MASPSESGVPVVTPTREHRAEAAKFKFGFSGWLDDGPIARWIADGHERAVARDAVPLAQLLASRDAAAEARGASKAKDRIRKGLARTVSEYEAMERQRPGANYGLRGEALRRFGELYLAPVVAEEAAAEPLPSPPNKEGT